MGRDDRCRGCGTVPSRSARFCGRCGELLGDVAIAGGAPPPPGPPVPRAFLRAALITLGVGVAVLVAVFGGRAMPADDRDLAERATGAVTADALDAVLLPSVDTVPRSRAVGDAAPGDQAAAGVCSGHTGPVDCVRWTTELGRAEPRSVVAAGWTVAIAEQDGRVRTFAASNGQPTWRHTATGPPRFHDLVAETLPITGDGATTFVDLATGRDVGAFEGRPRASAGAGPWLLLVHDGELEARSVTGSAAWRVPVPEDGLGWVTANGPYLTTPISLRRNRLVRLSSNTGQALWEHTVEGRVASLHPLGSATLVAVEDTGDGAALLVLDRRGTVLLDHRLVGRVTTVAADADGAAVVTHGPRGAELLLVDPLATEVIGPVSLGPAASWPWPLALDRDLVAVAHTRPAPGVTVLARRDGTVEHRLELPAIPRAVALPDGGTVIVAVDTEVSAWSLTSGTTQWWLDLGRPADVVSERPLLVRTDRTLLAIDADPTRPRRHPRGTTS
jgi:hypothetical protein